MLDLLVNVDRKRLLNNLATPVDRPMLELTLGDIIPITVSFFNVSNFVTVPFLPMDPTTWNDFKIYILGGSAPPYDIYKSGSLEKYILVFDLSTVITINASETNPIQRKAYSGNLSLNGERLIKLMHNRDRVRLRMLMRVKKTVDDLITVLDTPIVINNDAAFYQAPLLNSDEKLTIKHALNNKRYPIDISTDLNNTPSIGLGEKEP